VQVNASTGESCTVISLTAGAGSCTITFQTVESPTLTAVYSGDTNFSTSTSGGVPQTVTTATAALRISPASVNFGDVDLGGFAVQTVTLTNTGTSPINIRNISISQGHSNEFFAFSLSCWFPLGPGRSCSIVVTFVPQPHQTSVQSATLVITDSAAGSPQSVPLTANPINPQAALSTHSLTFSQQKVNTTSAPKSVMLTNTGTTPLNLKDIDVFGDFALAPGTTCADGGTVLPSASCIFYITFTPQAKGLRSGRLSISDNALFSPQEIFLFGTGN
jgi:HYDIN/CFA65/VesB family protein